MVCFFIVLRRSRLGGQGGYSGGLESGELEVKELDLGRQSLLCSKSVFCEHGSGCTALH